MASFVSKLSIHALVTQSSSNRMTTNEVTPLDLLFSIHSLLVCILHYSTSTIYLLVVRVIYIISCYVL